MILILPLVPSSLNFISIPLGTISKVPNMLFFFWGGVPSYPARSRYFSSSRYLSLFYFHSMVCWRGNNLLDKFFPTRYIFFFLVSTRSGLPAGIGWSICMSKSQKKLYISFSKSESGLCIYQWSSWPNFCLLHNSQWNNFHNQSYLL